MNSTIRANLFRDKRGLTLLEIILSLALLGIIVVSFLSVFTSGFMTIILMGNKSRAATEAQTVLDRIYAEADLTDLEDSINDILSVMYPPGPYPASSLAQLDSANTGTKIRYRLTHEALLYDTSSDVIEIRLYYDNYRRYVSLLSPIVR